MSCCINDLRDKEVINICDGRRLGCVWDAEVDTCDGKIVALIVATDGGGFFSRPEDVCVPWEAIKSIGDDIIIVDAKDLCPRGVCGCSGDGKKHKRGFFK